MNATKDERPLWVRLTHDQSGEPFIVGRWFCGWCYRFSRALGSSRRYSLSMSRSCKTPAARVPLPLNRSEDA